MITTIDLKPSHDHRTKSYSQRYPSYWCCVRSCSPSFEQLHCLYILAPSLLQSSKSSYPIRSSMPASIRMLILTVSTVVPNGSTPLIILNKRLHNNLLAYDRGWPGYYRSLPPHSTIPCQKSFLRRHCQHCAQCTEVGFIAITAV